MSTTIYNFLVVAAGGAIGSMLRYCVTLLYSGTQTILSLPTITVNIVGSFIIGFFFAYAAYFYLPPMVRLFLFVGLLGGFTTFSSFSIETLQLFRNSQYMYAILAILINNVGGLLAAFLGLFIGNKLPKLF